MSLSSRILFIGNFDQSRLRDAVVDYRQIVPKFEIEHGYYPLEISIKVQSCVYDQEYLCESKPFFVARLPVNKLLER